MTETMELKKAQINTLQSKIIRSRKRTLVW